MFICWYWGYWTDYTMSEETTNYRSQFYRKEWEKESWAQGWLHFSNQDSAKAFCKVCNKHLAAGKSELTKHAETGQHMKNAKEMQTNSKVTEYYSNSTSCIHAELNTVALIARRNVLLYYMDYLIPTLKHVASDSKIMQDMTCGRIKTTYLLTECLAVNAHETLTEELKEAKGFSFLCDKASDIAMNKISCINVRYLSHGAVKTQLCFFLNGKNLYNF